MVSGTSPTPGTVTSGAAAGSSWITTLSSAGTSAVKETPAAVTECTVLAEPTIWNCRLPFTGRLSGVWTRNSTFFVAASSNWAGTGKLSPEVSAVVVTIAGTVLMGKPPKSGGAVTVTTYTPGKAYSNCTFVCPEARDLVSEVGRTPCPPRYSTVTLAPV